MKYVFISGRKCKNLHTGVFLCVESKNSKRGLSNGSAAILNFQNGRHDERLEVTKTASSSLTSMKFGIEGYFVVLS